MQKICVVNKIILQTSVSECSTMLSVRLIL